MKKELFHYDKISVFNHRRYNDILTAAEIAGDEICIKDKQTEDDEFFFPLKKDKTTYLLPSDELSQLPLKVLDSEKISWRSKAYFRVTSVKSVRIVGTKTQSYKQFIDSFLPYDHETPDEFLIWKIICDVAYRNRINVRAISYPGWLKDSPLVILSMLRGDVSIVNKPSYAKLKYILSGKNKVLGLNEVQNLEAKDRRDLAKYYEDTGDFKPFFVTDTRASSGVKETADITNHSSMTFYNFPKKETDPIFDDMFEPKILSRVFPILLSGGTHERTACREKFGLVEHDITDEDFELMTEYLKNHVYYENHLEQELGDKKHWKPQHKFNSTRWQRNYDTILNGLRLYADDEPEFHKLENTLYRMHTNYKDYVKKRKHDVVVEDTMQMVDNTPAKDEKIKVTKMAYNSKNKTLEEVDNYLV